MCFFLFVFCVFFMNFHFKQIKQRKSIDSALSLFCRLCEVLVKLTFGFGLNLLDERGYSFKAKNYNYSFILQVQEEKVLDIQTKYRTISSNCRSYYFLNSLVVFDRRRVYVVILTLLGVDTYITILQICHEFTIYIAFLIINVMT